MQEVDFLISAEFLCSLKCRGCVYGTQILRSAPAKHAACLTGPHSHTFITAAIMAVRAAETWRKKEMEVH